MTFWMLFAVHIVMLFVTYVLGFRAGIIHLINKINRELKMGASQPPSKE